MPFTRGTHTSTEFKKGYKMPKEWKQKISQSHKGMKKPWAGKYIRTKKRIITKHWHLSEETKKKLSKALKGKYKNEKSWNWKGGITPLRKKLYFSEEYKKWRMGVFLRDNFTCQFCGIKGVYLEAHHIKKWANYPKLRFDINNGVSLCSLCHNLTKKGRPRRHIKNQNQVI